jgi:hypothetical protein
MNDQLKQLEENIKSQYDTSYLDETGILHNAYVHHLIHNPTSLIFNVNPFRMNERLTIQQGVFLIQGNIKIPFLQNLKARI